MGPFAAAFTLVGLLLLAIAVIRTGALGWGVWRRSPAPAAIATVLATIAFGVQSFAAASAAVAWEAADSGAGIAELVAAGVCFGLGLSAVRAWRAQIRSRAAKARPLVDR